jgi:hypothetical protein
LALWAMPPWLVVVLGALATTVVANLHGLAGTL